TRHGGLPRAPRDGGLRLPRPPRGDVRVRRVGRSHARAAARARPPRREAARLVRDGGTDRLRVGVARARRPFRGSARARRRRGRALPPAPLRAGTAYGRPRRAPPPARARAALSRRPRDRALLLDAAGPA